jgi:hypothetical protein
MDIRWVSAATPNYKMEMVRLGESFRRYDVCGTFKSVLVDKWQHFMKLAIIRREFEINPCDFVIWLDADCEFADHVSEGEVYHQDKPITTLQHFLFNRPDQVIPGNYKELRPDWDYGAGYWQACLYGVTRDGLSKILESEPVRWATNAGYTFDEHVLCEFWGRNRDLLLELPANYAAPTDSSWPQITEQYNSRNLGPPKIKHYNNSTEKHSLFY